MRKGVPIAGVVSKVATPALPMPSTHTAGGLALPAVPYPRLSLSARPVPYATVWPRGNPHTPPNFFGSLPPVLIRTVVLTPVPLTCAAVLPST